jgi:glutamine synthetase
MKPKEVLEFAKENRVQMVDIKFVDLFGIWQHFTIPVHELEEGLFEDGLGFDGSSIRGWTAINASDMLVMPDASTAKIDPFISYTPTLSLISDIVDPITREPYSRDPRFVARKAINYLKSTGIADVCYIGPEPEFFIFDEIRFAHSANQAFYELDSQEGAWNTGKRQVATFMPKPIFGDNGSGMHTHQSLWKDGKPLFYDERGYGGLSDIARWYIGGLLKHAPALLAFTNPTVNSYHRLVPGYEAPVNLVYSARNRSACIRIPIAGTSRRPSASSSGSRTPRQPLPRLRGAADGGPGRHQEPHRAAGAGGQGPLRAAPGGARRDQAGPRLAARGARRLEADHEFLLEGDVFTKDLIETWIEWKRFQ